MDKAQTVIYLVRHGQTNFSVDDLATRGAITVSSSSEEVYRYDKERVLTEKGKKDIEKVGRYLKDFMPVAIFSSPLKRALQTAEIIRQEAEIPGKIEIKNFLKDFYYRYEGAKKMAEVISFCRSLTRDFSGSQLVIISHLNPINEIVAELGFNQEELSSSLEMGQGYRLVFAGELAVECLKINPAGL